jgi:protein-S-isoprenylcysteine O-methyltransferase Ste14
MCGQRAVLSTMDITTEGFGFMLCFGDLVWVPFTYSLQARFLSFFPVALSEAALAAIVVVYVVGFAIFRLSNLEKDRFRRDPTAPAVQHLRTIPTPTGSRLLVSGWWGVARHINYLGDWLLFLASCLACGTGQAIPYFYVVYFGILLIHRERRDDAKCSRKYGPAWATYTALVPSRIIPYVY